MIVAGEPIEVGRRVSVAALIAHVWGWEIGLAMDAISYELRRTNGWGWDRMVQAERAASRLRYLHLDRRGWVGGDLRDSRWGGSFISYMNVVITDVTALNRWAEEQRSKFVAGGG